MCNCLIHVHVFVPICNIRLNLKTSFLSYRRSLMRRKTQSVPTRFAPWRRRGKMQSQDELQRRCSQGCSTSIRTWSRYAVLIRQNEISKDVLDVTALFKLSSKFFLKTYFQDSSKWFYESFYITLIQGQMELLYYPYIYIHVVLSCNSHLNSTTCTFR